MNLQPRDDLEEVFDELYPHLRGTRRMHEVLAIHESYTEDESSGGKMLTREARDGDKEKEIRKLTERKVVTGEASLKHDDRVRWFLAKSVIALMIVTFVTYILTRDIAVLGTTTLVGGAVIAVYRYYFTRSEN